MTKTQRQKVIFYKKQEIKGKNMAFLGYQKRYTPVISRNDIKKINKNYITKQGTAQLYQQTSLVKT